MWIVAIVLLLAIAYLGSRLYRIETEHPFLNAKGVASSVPRLSSTPPKPSIRTAPEAKRYCGYEKLLTNAEASFFGVLKLVVGEEHYVFSKVRMADVLQPVGQTPGARQSALNQICSKHLDFVVCRSGSWEIVAGVELDDASHREAARMERDAFVDEVFQQVGIPLMRVPAQSAYSVEEISARWAKVSAPANASRAAVSAVSAAKAAEPTGKRQSIPAPHQVLVAA